MQKITPCLWCNGNAEEAANFYVSVFKDAKILNISRYGEGAQLPAGTALTVLIELLGMQFTLLNAGPEFSFSEAISFQIDCADQAEVDYYWDALTNDGGQEGQCGWAKDKFGLSWQVIPKELEQFLSSGDAAASQRAFTAMMGMTKIDLEAMGSAFAGEQ
ncbi:MAG: VOC family protein [Acidobacteria bacterium]|nr:VOC family protein [Acidobacteriota bacterium]